jgi:hypothetical protein
MSGFLTFGYQVTKIPGEKERQKVGGMENYVSFNVQNRKP